MPSTVRATLNKSIPASFSAAELLTPGGFFPVAAYAVRVSQPLGISLTGFEAVMRMQDSDDIGPFSFVVIELLENFLMSQNQDQINATFFQIGAPGTKQAAQSIFYIEDTTNQFTNSVHRNFNYPVQLRYGLEYTLYLLGQPSLAPIGTPLHAGINIVLTALGFENADTSQPVIQLR